MESKITSSDRISCLGDLSPLSDCLKEASKLRNLNYPMRPIKTVLLTGASSYIGRHLVKYLYQSGFAVVGTYRTGSSGECDVTRRVVSSPPMIHLDISQKASFLGLPASIDAVVHVAAAANKPGTTSAEMYSANAAGTRNVLSYATSAGARKFIYTSTLSIHGKIGSGVVDENTPVVDPDCYGASKYLGEQILASAVDSMPTVALRLPGVLGFGAHRAWIPSLVERLLAGRDVSIYNADASFNNAVHVDDLGRFVAQLLAKRIWQGFSAFPVGASGPMTILDIVTLMRDTLRSKSVVYKSDVATPSFMIDSRCATELYEYAPTPMEAILTQYLKDLGRFDQQL